MSLITLGLGAKTLITIGLGGVGSIVPPAPEPVPNVSTMGGPGVVQIEEWTITATLFAENERERTITGRETITVNPTQRRPNVKANINGG